MKGQIRGIVEQLVSKHGNDKKQGQKAFTELFDKAIDEKKLRPEDFSLLELFNALCDPRHELDRENSEVLHEAVNSSAFPYATNKLISTVVLDGYDLNVGDAKELVTEYSAKRKTEDIVGFTDLEEPDEVLEGMPYHEETVDEKRVQIKSKKFGRIISLTKEMILFDQTDLILRKAATIGQKAGYQEAKNIFLAVQDAASTDLGISAAEWLVYDGSAADSYSTDHSSFDDGANTNSNQGSTAFGTAGMKAALTLLRKLKDHASEYITVVPTHVVVPEAKVWEAREMFSSEKQYDSAENAKNVFNNAYKVISHPILDETSAYYWYIGDFKKDIFMSRIWPMQVTMQSSNSESAFTSDIIKRFKVSNYWGLGAVDYRHRVLMAASA